MSTGISIAIKSQTLVSGVVLIDTVTYDTETLEKGVSKSFYFDIEPSKYTFSDESDRERWEARKRDVKSECKRFSDYLEEVRPFEYLSHNSYFERGLMKTFNCGLNLVPHQDLTQIGTFINRLYGCGVYGSLKFDSMCESHGIFKGNKAQKQLKLYRAMITSIQSDFKTEEAEESNDENCYYCGAKVVENKATHCWLCGRTSLPIAWVEFTGSLALRKPVLGQALHMATNLESIGENSVKVSYDKKLWKYYDTVIENERAVIRELLNYFNHSIDIEFILLQS